MADHDKPTVTSNYLDFVSEMHGRMDDLAVGLDPARTSATNVPNYSIRWSSVAKKWQYLDGSSWKDLTNEYAINISGSAAKLKNARTISITGGGTAQPVQFDGSANIQLILESLDLDNLTGLGSAAEVDVGTANDELRTNQQNDSRFIQGGSVVQETGNSTTNVMSQKAVTDALDSMQDGLGSAATRDVVSSNTDTSGGDKVITQGWMGLGGGDETSSDRKGLDFNDLSLYPDTGASFLYSTSNTNGPTSAGTYVISLMGNKGTWAAQIGIQHSGRMYVRTMSSGSWRDWEEVYHTGSILEIIYDGPEYTMTTTGSGTFRLPSGYVITGYDKGGQYHDTNRMRARKLKVGG